MRITRLTIPLAVLLLACAAWAAQDRKPIPAGEQSQYIVSAKSGVISVVEGMVMLKRRALPFTEAKSGQAVADDELSIGDSVSTSAGSRVEILLNPGCFLRVDQNTEVVYLTEDLVAAQRIKVLRGSAIVEAASLDDEMTVLTPGSKYRINEIGLYRFDVNSDGTSKIAVRKGKAEAGGVAVKGGRTATVVEGAPLAAAAIAKLDKTNDDFDNWSMDRARTLIASNKQLSNRTLRNTFAGSGAFNAWVYDPFCRCYTFLPYTYGFISPYGWGYSHYNPYWWNPTGYYWGGGRSGGNYSGGGGSSGGGGAVTGGDGGHHRPGLHPVHGGGGGGGGVITRPGPSDSSSRGGGGGGNGASHSSPSSGWSGGGGGGGGAAPVHGGGGGAPAGGGGGGGGARKP
jgi:FecR-like protein